MTALAGVAGLRPADDLFHAMLAAPAEQPASPLMVQLVSTQPPVGFAYAGTAMAHVDQATGCTITGAIRLDNRGELQSLLGEAIINGDAELAMRAYLRWGEQFAARLLGAFAIAIWDPRSAQLHLVRDHFGVRPLVYTATSDSMVFGSTVAAVHVGSPAHHQVYTDKLLHMLVDPLEAAEPNRTVFCGINYVPPASVVSWRHGESTRITRYWTLDAPSELRLASNAEYEDAFREVFTQAVECRLDATSPTGSMLSGGLDSSTITAVAAKLSSTGLRSYSAVETHPRLVSDTPFINAMIKHLDVDAVRLDEIELQRRFDITRLLQDPAAIFDDSMVVLWGAAQHAAENGCNVMLTGVCGDEVLQAGAGDVASDLLRAGHLGSAWQDLRQLDGELVARSLSARLALGQLVPHKARRARHGHRAHRLTNQRLVASGVDPHSPQAPALRALLVDLETNPEWTTPNDQLNGLRRPFLQVALDRYDRVAARHGVEVRHPMMDRRLVEFCLSIPATQRRATGWSKVILRRTLQGELPPEVIWRPKANGVLSPFISKVIEAERCANPEIDISGLPAPFTALLAKGADEQLDFWRRHVLTLWWRQHGSL